MSSWSDAVAEGFFSSGVLVGIGALTYDTYQLIKKEANPAIQACGLNATFLFSTIGGTFKTWASKESSYCEKFFSLNALFLLSIAFVANAFSEKDLALMTTTAAGGCIGFWNAARIYNQRKKERSDAVAAGFFSSGVLIGIGALVYDGYQLIKKEADPAIQACGLNATFLFSTIGGTIKTWASKESSYCEKFFSLNALFLLSIAFVANALSEKDLALMTTTAAGGCIGFWNAADIHHQRKKERIEEVEMPELRPV